jgi:serine phosphatase RsbU (regulator of sigma subunit)/anti-sigma regulatory factor (Ser/Thr protein kinase)
MGRQMATLAQTWRRVLDRARAPSDSQPAKPITAPGSPGAKFLVDIAPDDPILHYFRGTTAAVDVDTLDLKSPACSAFRVAGMKLLVPLVSQGELIALLSLGPRLSDLNYSRDDRRLLEDLAAQAAPAVRVAQLVRQQQSEAQTRAAMEQELRVARVIQQFFLPKTPPDLSGWEVGAHYRPAHAVGGDFYDFIPLPDGQLGIVIGDVADKGVPAALVMAATRGVLRASAQRLVDPADVLGRVNELIVPDTPPHIFVTCLYAVLDPTSGRLRYANAGHDPPYVRTTSGEAIALRARGMPLGVMSGYVYLSHETWLAPGEHVLFYSDGLVEAHNSRREMFSFDRLCQLIARHDNGTTQLIDTLLLELDSFVGQAWDQEDDVTLVALKRSVVARELPLAQAAGAAKSVDMPLLCDFNVERQLGKVRPAIARIVDTVAGLGLQPARLEALKTAVAEAITNGIEHADDARPNVPVCVRVHASAAQVIIAISNAAVSQAGARAPEPPDLLAKLEGRQQPRGWGVFLMQRLADEVNVIDDAGQYTVELTFFLSGPRC